MSVVDVQEVTRIYKQGEMETHALRGVSLEIEKGGFYALVGPSGSGKTTLLQMIGCLDKPTTGKVLIDGRDITNLNASKRADLRRGTIGFVFQFFALVPGLNTLTSWSQAPVMTSSQAFGYVIKYLAYMCGDGHNVLGVDIGGTTTTAAFVVGDEFGLVNCPDLGVSHSISRVISQTGIENITRWLPVELD